LFDDGGGQRFFGVEVVVEGALGHSRTLDDLAEPCGGVPDLTEQVYRGVKDLLAGGFRPGLGHHRPETSEVR
jgi:hypothetical protein